MEGLQSVTMSGDFDHPLGTLPSTLKELCFCRASVFSHPIEPHPSGNLRTAVFGLSMSHPLPPGLTHLIWHRNTPIHLYEGLKHLCLGAGFEQGLMLPTTLKSILFEGRYDLPLVKPKKCRVMGKRRLTAV